MVHHNASGDSKDGYSFHLVIAFVYMISDSH